MVLLATSFNAISVSSITQFFGYRGKQVRDNIHCYDEAFFVKEFLENPRSGEVYNLGGERDNSISIPETFDLVELISGNKIEYVYNETNHAGDHICYISNLSKIRDHFPNWQLTEKLQCTFEEIHATWRGRLRIALGESMGHSFSKNGRNHGRFTLRKFVSRYITNINPVVENLRK